MNKIALFEFSHLQKTHQICQKKKNTTCLAKLPPPPDLQPLRYYYCDMSGSNWFDLSQLS
jgi:hypothetical protein